MSPVLQVPAKVGVLGGGRMGAGIAHAFLASGASVTVVDINEDAVAAARERERPWSPPIPRRCRCLNWQKASPTT